MPFIERGGARIVYDVLGTDGPTVLLGHSLLCGRFMWDAVLPALTERFRVINVEVRGHGESTAPGDFSLEDLAEDWRAILDVESISSAHLIGLSMGGMTAMRFALRYPERAQSLALLDSSADPESRLNRVKYKGLAAVYRRVGFTDMLSKQIMPIMFGPDTLTHRPEVIQELTRHMRAHDRPGLIRAISAVNDRGRLEGLERLRMPTLVLVGEDDAATPSKKSEGIARQIPGAALHRLSGAGHLSAMEVPDVVARELLDFLEA